MKTKVVMPTEHEKTLENDTTGEFFNNAQRVIPDGIEIHRTGGYKGKSVIIFDEI